jgi:hypothetical protein
MRMYDLFSGLGGASQAFLEGGWSVCRFEKNSMLADPKSEDYVPLTDEIDLTHENAAKALAYPEDKVDFLWASPPCDEFSLAFPAPRSVASREGKLDEYEPDMKPLMATLEIIRLVKPRYWAIENVQGAIRYFEPHIGKHRMKIGSMYLWGNFPMVGLKEIDSTHKKKLFASTGAQTKLRSNVHAKTPHWLSEQMRVAVQYQMTLDDFMASLEDVSWAWKHD